MERDRFIYLVGKELTGELSAKETSELHELITESTSNQSLYSELKMSWEKAGNYKPSVKAVVADSWLKVEGAIRTPSSNRIFTLHPMVKVAAALLIAFGLGWFVISPFGEKSYETVAGESLEVVLPDMSVIFLNELSSITVNKDFNKLSRRISFEGEAYFDIEKDPSKPFIIQVKNSEIQVLGTSFNVDAKSASVKVDVTSGRVLLSEIGRKENNVILTQGLTGSYNSITGALESVEYENLNFQAWRTGVLEFNDLTMSEVIEDISEYFKIDIEPVNDTILECRFTSTFTNPTIEEVLEVASLTLNLTYENRGSHFTLNGNGCGRD